MMDIMSDIYAPAWITKRVSIGPAPRSNDHRWQIASGGMTHVIDCTCVGSESEWKLIVRPRVEYWHTPTDDDGTDKREWLERWTRHVLRILDGGDRVRVLIHCAAGINRSASLAYCVCRALGMPSKQIEESIRKVRPAAWAVGLRYRSEAQEVGARLHKERASTTFDGYPLHAATRNALDLIEHEARQNAADMPNESAFVLEAVALARSGNALSLMDALENMQQSTLLREADSKS